MDAAGIAPPAVAASRVCVIADPGANWRLTPEEALWRGQLRFRRLIEMTADAGADCFKPQFLRRTAYPEGSRESKLVAGYEWPPEWLPWLREMCEARGLEFLCTVYEPEHVALLDPFVKRWKVASFEAQRPDLLRAMVATGKPLIVSLGLGADWFDTHTAIERMAAQSAPYDVTYLHCVSAYPARPEHMNVYAVGDVDGLSDHTTGTTAAIMAVALGATTIEKHIRTADVLHGPDAGFALDPAAFRVYVAAIREAEVMLGDGVKLVQPGEVTWAKWSPVTGKRGTMTGTT